MILFKTFMEEIMSLNKVVIFITIFAVIAIIAIPTFYKVTKENQKKLIIVNDKLVTEKAKECIYDGICKTNKVTLKELYKNLYLQDTVVNPIDKSVYNEESYVLVTKDEATFYPKN